MFYTHVGDILQHYKYMTADLLHPLFDYSRKTPGCYTADQEIKVLINRSSYQYVLQTGYTRLKAAHMRVSVTFTPTVLIAVS